MPQYVEKVSNLKLPELYKGYVLVAQTAEYYIDNKKLLKSLYRFARKNARQLGKSRLPLNEDDLQEACRVTSEMCEALLKLSKVKRVNDFNVWKGRLVDSREKLQRASERLAPQEDDINRQASSVNGAVGATVAQGDETVKKNSIAPS